MAQPEIKFSSESINDFVILRFRVNRRWVDDFFELQDRAMKYIDRRSVVQAEAYWVNDELVVEYTYVGYDEAELIKSYRTVAWVWGISLRKVKIQEVICDE